VVVKKSFWADRSIKLRKINFLLVASRCHQELMISEMKKTLTIRISAKKNMFWYFKWVLQLLSNPIECTHFYQRFFRASKQFIKKQKKLKTKIFLSKYISCICSHRFRDVWHLSSIAFVIFHLYKGRGKDAPHFSFI
jgi:hypothetical protein